MTHELIVLEQLDVDAFWLLNASGWRVAFARTSHCTMVLLGRWKGTCDSVLVRMVGHHGARYRQCSSIVPADAGQMAGRAETNFDESN